MYVRTQCDSRVQQTAVDLKAISLTQVKCAGSSHRLAGYDLEHVWITFMSDVEVINKLLCAPHVNVHELFHAAGWHEVQWFSNFSQDMFLVHMSAAFTAENTTSRKFFLKS